MLTNRAILVFSALLLFAYLLDIVGRRFRLPAVVLLIATGMVSRQLLDRLGIFLAWVDPLVPVMGTIGLVLIVLEGALDLSLRGERTGVARRASAAALAGFVACTAAFTFAFEAWFGLARGAAALAAMPFAVISSAVAIPSAVGLAKESREFVTYESSISDILGVLVFYAWLGAQGDVGAFASDLFGGGALSLAAALAAGVGLLYLINRVQGHVRFLPLLAGLLLLYSIGKGLHLSPLVLVLVCGLLLNNPQLLERNRWLGRIFTAGYPDTLAEFKGLVVELTFAVRSFFFLMLGYWTELGHMGQWQAWAAAAAVVAVVYASRWVILRALGERESGRLTWLAPRGLITVLLFLSASETGLLGEFPFGTVMLVVLATATLTGLAHRGATAAPRDEPAASDAAAVTTTADSP